MSSMLDYSVFLDFFFENFLFFLLIFIFFSLIWGSFLNMIAYRLIHGGFKRSRSFCPHCKATIHWYDNIPIISYILLWGSCRACKKSISILYPVIEILTPVLLLLLYYRVPDYFFWPYFLYFSALIVTIRTDLETMLISRFATLFLIPVFWLLAIFNFLPISFFESIFGACSAFVCLYLVARIFVYFMGKEGMGQGDIDLLGFIGACTGFVGWWFSLLLGSMIGSFIGIILILLNRDIRSQKIPFGPFLSIGAILYILYGVQIMHVLRLC
ncbi:MAG TPA: prepilin peptidase [Candidatus Babeliales bacterium]|nr:prepilin peptidase [Candidatus Babeliales bacterium]